MPDQDERDRRAFVAGAAGFETGDGVADALAGRGVFLKQRPGAVELLPVEAVDGLAAVRSMGCALMAPP
jgi:hypothetical protein